LRIDGRGPFLDAGGLIRYIHAFPEMEWILAWCEMVLLRVLRAQGLQALVFAKLFVSRVSFSASAVCSVTTVLSFLCRTGLRSGRVRPGLGVSTLFKC
jgi:hypothetical protein